MATTALPPKVPVRHRPASSRLTGEAHSLTRVVTHPSQGRSLSGSYSLRLSRGTTVYGSRVRLSSARISAIFVDDDDDGSYLIDAPVSPGDGFSFTGGAATDYVIKNTNRCNHENLDVWIVRTRMASFLSLIQKERNAILCDVLHVLC